MHVYLGLSGAYARVYAQEFYDEVFYNSTYIAFNTQQIKLLNSNKSLCFCEGKIVKKSKIQN